MSKKSARPKTFQKLKKKLKAHRRVVGKALVETPKKAHKFLTQTEVPVPQITEIGQKGVRLAAAGALTGALLLTPDGKEKEIVKSQESTIHQEFVSEKVPVKGWSASGRKSQTITRILAAQLEQVLPPSVRPLTKKEEQEIERILSANLGTKTVAELDGHRLNTNFGLIGQEQHLLRHPQDTISEHDEFQEAGLAPKTPAWGYIDIDKEKYYVAVQTFLSPGWNNNSYVLKEWFKYRKVLVVNPKDGSAVVAVIGDAGPASWTGKQYGGSPEVIDALNLPAKRGEVLLFFIDDPEDKIPLGPLEIDKNANVGL